MKTWYIPSFHGDFRFEAKSEKETLLTVEKPTPGELAALRRWADGYRLTKGAIARGWINKRELAWIEKGQIPSDGIMLAAPVIEAAAPMAKLLGLGKVGNLTALKSESGGVQVTQALDEEELPKWMREAKDATAAVTVSRPKLSCPECSGRTEGSRKSCDVLWEFLDGDQRAEWLRGRRFTAFGSLTGHAYDIAPRDTRTAALRGRICFDMDDRVILHNFNLGVPPEEEALAAKIILEFREDWLRVYGEVDPTYRATLGTIFESPLPVVM